MSGIGSESGFSPLDSYGGLSGPVGTLSLLKAEDYNFKVTLQGREVHLSQACKQFWLNTFGNPEALSKLEKVSLRADGRVTQGSYPLKLAEGTDQAAKKAFATLAFRTLKTLAALQNSEEGLTLEEIQQKFRFTQVHGMMNLKESTEGLATLLEGSTEKYFGDVEGKAEQSVKQNLDKMTQALEKISEQSLQSGNIDSDDKKSTPSPGLPSSPDNLEIVKENERLKQQNAELLIQMQQLQFENAEHQKLIEKGAAKLQSLKEALETAKVKIGEQEIEITSLNEQLSSAKQQVETLGKEKASLDEQIKNLKRELQQEKLSLDKSEKAKSVAETTKKSLNEQVETLQQELQRLQDSDSEKNQALAKEITTLKEVLQQATNKEGMVTGELEQLKQTREKNKAKIENLEKKILQVNETVKKKDSAIDHLNEKLSSLKVAQESSMERLSEENAALKVLIDQQSQALKDNEALTEQVERLDKANRQLQGLVTSLDATAKTSENQELAALKDREQQLTNELATMKEKVEKLEQGHSQQIEKMQKEHSQEVIVLRSEHSKSIEALNQKHKDLQTRLEKKQKEVASKETEVTSLKRELKNMETSLVAQNSGLEEAKLHNKGLTNEVNKTREKLQHAEKELQSQKAVLSRLSTQLNQQQETIQQQNRELENQTKGIEALKQAQQEALDKLQKQHDEELEKLKAENKRLNGILENMKKKNDAMFKEAEEAKKETSRLKNNSRKYYSDSGQEIKAYRERLFEVNKHSRDQLSIYLSVLGNKNNVATVIGALKVLNPKVPQKSSQDPLLDIENKNSTSYVLFRSWVEVFLNSLTTDDLSTHKDDLSHIKSKFDIREKKDFR